MGESSGTAVICPENPVLLGREHDGDENGTTTYYCGSVHLDGELVRVSAPSWSTAQRESHSAFSAGDGHVLVGQQHTGDENGSTGYQYARIVG